MWASICVYVMVVLEMRKCSSSPAGVAFTQQPYLQPNLNKYIPSERSVDSEFPSCTLPFGSGEDNMGVCVPKEYYADQLSFCGDVVNYVACVPPRQPLWESWNATTKDQLLELQFKKVVDERIAREMTQDNSGNYIPVRFAQNMDCIESFRRALCWANFPACTDTGISVPVCRAACKNYMADCKYSDTAICDDNPAWPYIGDQATLTPPITSTETSIQCTGSASFTGISFVTLAVLAASLVLINSPCCSSLRT